MSRYGKSLTLTPAAVQLVRELVTEAHRPPGAGLRIAQRDDHVALAMRVADLAEPGDTTLIEEHLSVFLGPRAAVRLVDQTLDARTGAGGRSLFLRSS